MKFITDIPLYCWLLSALIGALISGIIYFKGNSGNILSKQQHLILSSIRFLGASLLALLLLSPLIKGVLTTSTPPTIWLAVDNSSSLVKYKDKYTNIVNSIKSSLEQSKQEFEVREIYFGQEASAEGPLDFKDDVSDYAQMIQQVQRNSRGKNVGAAIILGDGIYNRGISPVYPAKECRFAFNTITVGDSANYFDQEVLSVTHRKTVQLHNTFNLQVDLKFNKCLNQYASLEILENNKEIYKERFNIDDDNFYVRKSIPIKTETQGLRHYQVRLKPLRNEVNIANNEKSFAINVVDRNRQILIATHGPHPDIRSIRNALDNQSGYQTTIAYLSDKIPELQAYDAVVLYQVPSAQQQIPTLLKNVVQLKKPCMIITGPQTNYKKLNDLLLGFKFQPLDQASYNQINTNDNFMPFKVEREELEQFKTWTPLLSNAKAVGLSNSYSALLTELKDSRSPKLFVGSMNKQRICCIVGEGIWQWPVQSYLKENSFNTYNQLLGKIFNFLTDQETGAKFKIEHPQSIQEYTPLIVRGSIYDDTFNPIRDLEIKMNLTDSTGKNFSFVMNDSGDGYQLNLGNFPAGIYQLQCVTTIGNEEYTKNSELLITKNQLEKENIKANFNMMNNLALQTGGQSYSEEQIDQLINDLESAESIKTREDQDIRMINMIDYQWLALILIIIISLEWFLRKFWGTV
ncbi:hypothetical protein EYV94_18545 [Puteibacter caeruleilacunae]|nr:hypothetical protein EYV94_18545 [Puteibacter caeruleilacunae]